MSPSDEERIAQITEICRRLGSPLGQAETMARQLWKRSGQLAVERGIKQYEALDHLLTVMISGRNGAGPDEMA